MGDFFQMNLHSQVRISKNEVQKGISHCCEIQCRQEAVLCHHPQGRSHQKEGLSGSITLRNSLCQRLDGVGSLKILS